jgi:hypothetical protein
LFAFGLAVLIYHYLSLRSGVHRQILAVPYRFSRCLIA